MLPPQWYRDMGFGTSWELFQTDGALSNYPVSSDPRLCRAIGFVELPTVGAHPAAGLHRFLAHCFFPGKLTSERLAPEIIKIVIFCSSMFDFIKYSKTS